MHFSREPRRAVSLRTKRPGSTAIFDCPVTNRYPVTPLLTSLRPTAHKPKRFSDKHFSRESRRAVSLRTKRPGPTAICDWPVTNRYPVTPLLTSLRPTAHKPKRFSDMHFSREPRRAVSLRTKRPGSTAICDCHVTNRYPVTPLLTSLRPTAHKPKRFSDMHFSRESRRAVSLRTKRPGATAICDCHVTNRYPVTPLLTSLRPTAHKPKRFSDMHFSREPRRAVSLRTKRPGSTAIFDCPVTNRYPVTPLLTSLRPTAHKPKRFSDKHFSREPGRAVSLRTKRPGSTAICDCPVSNRYPVTPLLTSLRPTAFLGSTRGSF